MTNIDQLRRYLTTKQNVFVVGKFSVLERFPICAFNVRSRPIFSLIFLGVFDIKWRIMIVLEAATSDTTIEEAAATTAPDTATTNVDRRPKFERRRRDDHQDRRVNPDPVRVVERREKRNGPANDREVEADLEVVRRPKEFVFISAKLVS